jgi:hypothetical protein
MTPRGYRNNNPGNIRKSNSMWLGKVEKGSDGAFEQFVSMEYGLRAMMKLLIKYLVKYKAEDIRGIIERWAPASENDVSAYVATVVNRSGFGPYDEIKPEKEYIIPITKAMCFHENGIDEIPLETYEKAWELI